MKILLAALNAKYIHSNPAVHSLKAYAGRWGKDVEIAEYTINHALEAILSDIYRKEPEVLAFSCYIWNIEMIKVLLEEVPKVLPDTVIWLGGPEVSYDAEDFIHAYPAVTGVMTGEGEAAFRELMEYYQSRAAGVSLSTIKGIVYRNDDGTIRSNPPREPMNLDDIPFFYEDLSVFENRILYYETSRGCPFSCSYCLSSIDKKVRFRNIDLVVQELQFFLDHRVKQVKFVDRTFNCSHRHAKAVWAYLRDHDNGVTNFHFEISADLLDEDELELLASLRPGLVQLEIGVQSVHEATVQEIRRTMEFEKLSGIVKRIQKGHNIHQHLDLIAGLPKEDYQTFQRSFDAVYDLRPDQLQLGFLKVLKGSYLHQEASRYEICYSGRAPYEVRSTAWISYREILQLKEVEEMAEIYYNSGQFVHTMEHLVRQFDSPFRCYEALADFYGSHGLTQLKHARMHRYTILLDFIKELRIMDESFGRELLLLDLYLREKLKSRPDWAPEQKEYKDAVKGFYQREKDSPSRLLGYEAYSARQMAGMTHVEVFAYPVLAGMEESGAQAVLFDYQKRDPLNHQAAVSLIRL